MTQREIVIQAMRERPEEIWPHGDGHIILATPGSPRSQKAYYEPGGGFSPSPGSFGVSLRIERNGQTIAASETAAAADRQETFDWKNRGCLSPAVLCETTNYFSRWEQMGEGRWHGHYRAKNGAAFVLFRSVGPAGAPLWQIDWDGRQLLLNRRWVVTFSGAGNIYLGDESLEGLAHYKHTHTISSESGWAFARIEASSENIEIFIHDTEPVFLSPLPAVPVKAAIEIDFPDPRFVASLDAQAAHLLMGFTGRQTCPGEPTNYPLAWERDGAYAVMAMARCGHLDIARELVWHFAENDFFGGFGSEGDAPGSALQAILTVAALDGSKEFLDALWPHILRKVGIIEEMMTAKTDIQKPFVGPLVPQHIGAPNIGKICMPARDNLVIGNMDLHFPVLYITAFCYRGLHLAARAATRLGHLHEAARWNGEAETLRSAWHSHFSDKDLANERTFMSAVWPTWIARPDFAPLRQALDKRWKEVHSEGNYDKRPLWTYFTLAEAHQWLFLGDICKVWKTLNYFWANQCCPGLYSYWEGHGEENSFHLWEHLRGWVRPRHVTPHYWTAAEMLLLQIDMLAYHDEYTNKIVTRAGIPHHLASAPHQHRN